MEYFLGDKGGRCVRLTTLPPSCADSWSFKLLEPSGLTQACYTDHFTLKVHCVRNNEGLFYVHWCEIRYKTCIQHNGSRSSLIFAIPTDYRSFTVHHLQRPSPYTPPIPRTVRTTQHVTSCGQFKPFLFPLRTGRNQT